MQANVIHRDIPARPACWGQVVTTATLPEWLPYMVLAIGQGRDPEYAGNGISFADGNILLYRRISEREWALFPSLAGIKEIWLEFDTDLSLVS